MLLIIPLVVSVFRRNQACGDSLWCCVVVWVDAGSVGVFVSNKHNRYE